MKDGIKFSDFGAQLIGILWFVREAVERLRVVLESKPKEKGGEPFGKADLRLAFGIAAAFFLVCLIRLGTPTKMYFDEVHHVRTAMEYIEGRDPHEWTHPPLAKLLMAASMKIGGVHFDPSDGAWSPDAMHTAEETFAWRFPSVCFGALSLLALYFLGRTLFHDRLIATAATVLLALDGVFFVQSRIAMTNIHTVCFILITTIGTWKYVQTERRAWLLLTGLALGLSLATRWSSLWAWGFTGLVLLWHLFRNQWPRWTKEKRLGKEVALWILMVAAIMIVLPLLLYMAAYIPFVLQGKGDWKTQLFTGGEPGPITLSNAFERSFYASGHGWFKVLNQQKDMWIYHSEIKEGHPYSSPWWSWPMMVRPVWYYYQAAPGTVSGVWCLGNGVIWWPSVPSLIGAIYFARREKSPALGVIALFGIGMWLAWGIKPRPLIFMHYYFECIPFVCLAVAYIGARLWRSGDDEARQFVRTFAIAAIAWAVFFYPLLAAVPVPDWFFRSHIWFDRGWI